jgi:hypothetical protein
MAAGEAVAFAEDGVWARQESINVITDNITKVFRPKL